MGHGSNLPAWMLYADGSRRYNPDGSIYIPPDTTYTWDAFLNFEYHMISGKHYIYDGWGRNYGLAADEETAQAMCQFVREHGLIRLVVWADDAPESRETIVDLLNTNASRNDKIQFVRSSDGNHQYGLKDGQYKIFIAYPGVLKNPFVLLGDMWCRRERLVRRSDGKTLDEVANE